MKARAHRHCSHLREEHFEQLAGPLWCVRCDGDVHADGTVIRRADLINPPCKRNLGVQFERVLAQRISFANG